jgi:hypothetical protein
MCALWNSDKSATAEKKRNHKFAQQILSDILEQRSKIRLLFEEGLTGIKNMSAAMTGFDAHALTLEVSSLKSAPKIFVGKNVSCYFSILDETNKLQNFYIFESQVTRAELRENGLVYFTLAQPREIKPSQQRRSVRVPVNQERIPLFLVWRELSSGTNVSDIPPLINSDTCAKNSFKVENISSCGLRLLMQNTLMSEVLPNQSVGEVFSFYFKAIAEPETPAKPFLLNATLRNIFSDPQKGETSLGFEFIAEGGLNKHKKLVWTPLKSHEVYNLIAFIFKWNLLDFHRDKRIDE